MTYSFLSFCFVFRRVHCFLSSCATALTTLCVLAALLPFSWFIVDLAWMKCCRHAGQSARSLVASALNASSAASSASSVVVHTFSSVTSAADWALLNMSNCVFIYVFSLSLVDIATHLHGVCLHRESPSVDGEVGRLDIPCVCPRVSGIRVPRPGKSYVVSNPGRVQPKANLRVERQVVRAQYSTVLDRDYLSREPYCVEWRGA